MASLPVRKWLATKIKPLLPNGWRINPYQALPGTFTVTTVVIKHLEIEPMAEAPLGQMRHSFTVTIADPHEDQNKAEDALDDSVTSLMTAIDTHPQIAWTSAKKVLISPERPYLGWDITLTVITNKTNKKET